MTFIFASYIQVTNVAVRFTIRILMEDLPMVKKLYS